MEPVEPRMSPTPAEISEWDIVREHLRLVSSGEIRAFDYEFDEKSPVADTYMRGISFLIRNEVSNALATFDRLRPSDVPADLAYVTYRLESTMRPATRSAYADVLLDGIGRNEVTWLTAARVLSQEGRLEESLTAYASTNPADWRAHDLERLRAIALNSAFEVDVKRIVWRALSRSGIEADVEAGLVLIVRGEFPKSLERQAVNRLATDPAANAAASESLRKMQEVRSLFMAHQYEVLMNRFGTSDPTSATTETCTVLFLAALKTSRNREVYRWGQELKRRHPDDEMSQWVANLTLDFREGSG
jgi:hypothetical protein